MSSTVLLVAISFDAYPRRLVDVPGGGKVLLLIRRNIAAKATPWSSLDNWQWDWEFLSRLVRRDRTWRVEDYGHYYADPISVPRDDPARYWVCRDKVAAADLAERISKLLATGATLPPSPDPERVL